MRGTKTAKITCLLGANSYNVNKKIMKGVSLGMKKRFQKLMNRFNKRSGQSLVEYALILALISVVAILVLRGIGSAVNVKLSNVNDNLK